MAGADAGMKSAVECLMDMEAEWHRLSQKGVAFPGGELAAVVRELLARLDAQDRRFVELEARLGLRVTEAEARVSAVEDELERLAEAGEEDPDDLLG